MSEVVGIGVDIIEVARVRGVLARHGERFLKRIYTPREREQAARLRHPAPYYAGRFAAKEAVLKVLGTGLSAGVSWQDVEIRREASGRPAAVLKGAALRRAEAIGIGAVLVSISHSREHAVAQAVGLRSGCV